MGRDPPTHAALSPVVRSTSSAIRVCAELMAEEFRWTPFETARQIDDATDRAAELSPAARAQPRAVTPLRPKLASFGDRRLPPPATLNQRRFMTSENKLKLLCICADDPHVPLTGARARASVPS